jgi:hypothetical protein
MGSVDNLAFLPPFPAAQHALAWGNISMIRV